jgi:hypothetical protein
MSMPMGFRQPFCNDHLRSAVGGKTESTRSLPVSGEEDEAVPPPPPPPPQGAAAMPSGSTVGAPLRELANPSV